MHTIRNRYEYTFTNNVRQCRSNTEFLVIRTEVIIELSEITLRASDNSVICFGRSSRYSYNKNSISYSVSKQNICKHTNSCMARKLTNKLNTPTLLRSIEILMAVLFNYKHQ